jgi:hypothetical protein
LFLIKGVVIIFVFGGIMTTMGTTRIIITTTTITDQTQRSIGLGFHYQQGLGRGGGLPLPCCHLWLHKKKKVILIIINTIVTSKRNGGQWVEFETPLLNFFKFFQAELGLGHKNILCGSNLGWK